MPLNNDINKENSLSKKNKPEKQTGTESRERRVSKKSVSDKVGPNSDTKLATAKDKELRQLDSDSVPKEVQTVEGVRTAKKLARKTGGQKPKSVAGHTGRSLKRLVPVKQSQGKSANKKTDLLCRYRKYKPDHSRKKRVPFSQVWWAYALSFALIAIGAYFISPYNRVSSIQVEGTYSISAKEVIAASNLKVGMSKLYAKEQEAAVARRIINQYPQIQAVTMSFNQKEQLILKVKEQRNVGMVQLQDFYYVVTENEQVLKRAYPEMLPNLPEIIDFTNQQVLQVARQLKTLPDDLLAQIKTVKNIERKDYPNRIVLELKDGNLVTGLLTQFADNFKYYPQVKANLKEKKGIIDMEAGIYFSEKTPLNDPFATSEEKEAYRKEKNLDPGEAPTTVELMPGMAIDPTSQSQDSLSTTDTSQTTNSRGTSTEDNQ